jgi:PAS domain S-box-containing protein
MDNTHEWCAEGIEPHIQRLKGLSTDDFAWHMATIKSGKALHVPRVADLPPEAAVEKEEWELEGIQSLVCVPMLYEGSVMGFAGFDSVRAEKIWDDDIIALLKIAGEMFSSTLERKRAEDALRESEGRYRTFVDNSLMGIYVTQDGKLRFANRRLIEMLGYSEEELLGTPFLDLIHPDDRGRARERGIQRYAEKHPPGYGRYRAITKSGDIRWVEAIGTLVDFQGRRAILGNINDITERKRAEDALKESEARYRHLSESLEETVKNKVEELKQAESLAAIGRMVSTVAHEIRNPLQNIQIGVDAMHQETEDKEELAEILGGIDYGVNSLNRIITELLEYSRPVKLEYSSISIRDLIEQALKTQAHKLGGVETELKLDDGDRMVVADEVKLGAVLVNLISNAAEAMPDGGKLVIRSKFQGTGHKGSLWLSIFDTGQGIGREYMERIEEPFFTTKVTGTGLGLPICKKIIEAHKGSIRISSRFGKGTTIEIMLPLHDSQTPEIPHDGAP